MAVTESSIASLLSSRRLKWASQPVIFHHKTGVNIELSRDKTVATSKKHPLYDGLRTHYNYGIVITSEPVPIGAMLKVTLLQTNTDWKGGLVRQTLITSHCREYRLCYVYFPRL